MILGTEINTRQPIFTLPVELLARVFEDLLLAHMTALPHGFGWVWDPRFKDSTTLIPVSQTCRHLRNVALSTSSLWAHIYSGTLGITGRRHCLPRPGPKFSDLCISRSRTSPLVVVGNPDMVVGSARPTDPVLSDLLNSNTTSHIEELHLLRTEEALLDSLESILSSTHRPQLKALSCRSPPASTWNVGTLALDHEQLPVLQHLCLNGVPFRLLDPLLRQPFLSLTHLVLMRTKLVNTHTGVESLLRLCPNLRCVVLSLHLRGARAHSEANDPLPTPTPLRRLVLNDLDEHDLRFYLSLFPIHHPIALQVLTDTRALSSSFRYEPMLKARLHGKLTHVRVAIFPDLSTMCEGYRFSVTLATQTNAVRVSSNVGALKHSVYHAPDTWLGSLLSEDAVDVSDLREAWLVNVAALFITRVPPFNAAPMAAVLRRMPLLDTLVLVTVVNSTSKPGAGKAVAADLSVLPDAAHAEGSMTPLKTLRLVYYDSASSPYKNASTGYYKNGITVRFHHMLHQLAAGTYRYVEHLVVEMSPRFEVDDAERVVEGLRAHFQTVRIERIAEMPEMPLPACCVEPDSGPGGSYTWTNPLM